MAFRRTAIRQFSLANNAYKNAIVTFYKVNPDTLVASTELATIYTASSGAGVAPNPYTLDSHGKTLVPLYAEEPIIAAVSQSAVPNHETGIIYPSLTGFRGNWAGATDYLVGDIVIDDAAGANTKNLYIALTDHTSGIWATDLAAAKWQLIIDVADIVADATAAAVATVTNYFATSNEIPSDPPEADGTDSMAIGNAAVVDGTRAMAIGKAYASGTDSICAQNGDNTTSYGAQAANSAIYGGLFNVISGANLYCAIVGGQSNSITSTNGAGSCGIVGGRFMEITGDSFAGGSVGGDFNSIEGYWCGIVGGRFHECVGDYIGAVGGSGAISGDASAMVGGINAEIVDSNYCAIVGGSNASLTNCDYSVIIGGTNSDMFESDQSVILGGSSGFSGDGNGNVVLGGSSATAFGERCIAGGGANNTAQGEYMVCLGGFNNTAFGDYGFIGGGNSNNIFSDYSFIAGGRINGTSADYTLAHGEYADARLRGMRAFGNGGLVASSVLRNCQGGDVVARRQTTTSTPAELFLDGSAERFAVPSGYALTFEIQVLALRVDSGNEVAGYLAKGVIKNSGGTTAFVGTPTVEVLGEDTAAWDFAVSADNTNDALGMTVTGENSKTINWVATIRWTETYKA